MWIGCFGEKRSIGCHVHASKVAGLIADDWASSSEGVDIGVAILSRVPATAANRHAIAANR
jgi:hypothetical protein